MVYVNFVLIIYENIEFYIFYNDIMFNKFFLVKDWFDLLDKEFLKMFIKYFFFLGYDVEGIVDFFCRIWFFDVFWIFKYREVGWIYFEGFIYFGCFYLWCDMWCYFSWRINKSIGIIIMIWKICLLCVVYLYVLIVIIDWSIYDNFKFVFIICRMG